MPERQHIIRMGLLPVKWIGHGQVAPALAALHPFSTAVSLCCHTAELTCQSVMRRTGACRLLRGRMCGCRGRQGGMV